MSLPSTSFRRLIRGFFHSVQPESRSKPRGRKLFLEELEPRITPTVLPTGFEESLVVSGLSTPTAETFTPDGRILVLEKGSVPQGSTTNIALGNVRVVKNGALLPTPFLTVPVDNFSEHGLDGITLDPNFSQNGYVYIYYTKPDPANPNVAGNAAANRLSRFTVSSSNPDIVDTNSELVLLDNFAAPNGFHNGGSLQFGADGMLYLGVGEGGFPTSAQDINSYYGKILRLNPSDPTHLAPSDNPFFDASDGITVKDYVWAYGFRNPFTSAMKPGTNTLFVNDVGGTNWEEVDNVLRGQNYGWPNAEGVSNNPAFTNPQFAYNHNGAGAAVTGAQFYLASQFPSEYQGTYFFGDYVTGTIRNLDLTTDTVSTFATGASFPVDLDVGPDGGLYYLSIGTGTIHKILFVGISDRAPAAVASASPSSGHAPLTVSFDGSGSTDPDNDSLIYTWNFGDGTTGTGATVGHTYSVNGSYSATLTVSDRPDGSGLSNTSAPLIITVGNTAPTPTITAPSADLQYSGGDTINFAGTATDPEDGTLSASAYHWSVIFGHNTHTHPFIDAIDGVTSGSFQIPTTGETDEEVYYRIRLTVTDSGGLQTTTFTDIHPHTSTFTLATNVPGLALNLDGQPMTALPTSVVGVVGIQRTLDTPLLQQLGGTNFKFVSWSDGGAANHAISTPTNDTTYTANYVAIPVAVATANTTNGPFPLTVAFNGQASRNPIAGVLTYNWDFGDGATENGALVSHTFPSPGVYAVRLTVTNADGQSNTTAPIYISPPSSVYVSDLSASSSVNGYGPVEKDLSNGENGAGDGHTIALNGVTYAKGLGVNSYSEVRYNLGGAYTSFVSDVGIDDEAGANGSVTFQVWADGTKLFDSGIMTGNSPTQHVNVDLTGRNQLVLIVTNGGDNSNSDHADWAGARLFAVSSTYLSDLTATSTNNGYGPVEKDSSNGENGLGDGHSITLNGITYAKGLGTHADSEIHYSLGGAYSRFISDIGVDDEVGNEGSVVFQVWADGTKLFDSGLMRGPSATRQINISVAGRNELVLIVANGGDFYSNDHADWANARLVVDGPKYVSDLTATSAVNGFGPVEKDKSNGENGAGDGRTLTLNGVTYAKGLGTHSYSEVHYALSGAYTSFVSDVGVDDEVGSNGSVAFQVWADGTKLFDSGVMTGTSATQHVSVNVAGRSDLALIVTNGGDNSNSDHGDWAGAFLMPDSIAPTVVGIIPGDNTNNVQVTSVVRATFSEPINPTSLTGSNFTVVKQGTSVPVAGTITYDAASRTATLTPAASLEVNATYVVTLSGGFNGVRDLAGNTLFGSAVSTFLTPDTIAPTVVGTSPLADSTGVVRSADIKATFSEALNPTTLTTATFFVTRQGDTVPVPATVTYDPTSRTATLHVSAPLGVLTSYSATIKGGSSGVKDLSGNALASDYLWQFTTGTAVFISDLTAVSSINGHGPVEKDLSNGENGAGDGRTLTLNGVTYAKGLGVHAYSEVHYNLAGVYAGFTADVGVDDEMGTLGSVAFQVWADGAKLFDSGVMTGTSATQHVSIDLTGHTDLALIVTDGGNGVAADHGDWANAQLITDTTPPGVVTISPAVGATGVPITSAATAIFSEVINPATLTAANVFLVKQGTTTPLAATISYDAPSRTVTLRPSANLQTDRTYVVTLKGGAGGASDLAGNPLPTDVTWSFHTVAPVVTVNGAPANSSEGTAISLTSTVTDPSPPFVYAWSVTKNGAAFTSGAAANFAFTPNDNGTYIVTLSVTDNDGSVGTDSKTITVTNVSPTAAIVGAPATSPEGTTISLTSTVTDPGSADTAAGFTYAWSVTKNGAAFASGTTANLAFTPNDNGTYFVTLAVTDKDGATGTAPAKAIIVTNVPPTASIVGAPATSPEGTAISLTSTVTDPSSADTAAGFTYAWNVTKNGAAFASGTAANFNFTPDDNGTYVVSLTVMDKDGGQNLAAIATIAVTNVAPTPALISSGTVRGQNQTYIVTAGDPSAADRASGFIYMIDWKDGSALQTVPRAAGNGSGVTVAHLYTQTGTFAVLVTVTDKDGGSTTVTSSITVSAAALQTDYTNSAKTVLVVGGTAGADTIALTPADTLGNIAVVINGTSVGTFRPTGHIVVYGQAGDDTIRLASAVIGGQTVFISVPAVLSGDDGNDTIDASGSSANNVLLGGTGNDILTAGPGRSLLIGGLGADTLRGGGGDDILIGSTTDFEANLAALDALMIEWGRTDINYATRVNHLMGNTTGGLNGNFLLTLNTVRDDAFVDDLTGGAGLDWFWVKTTGSTKDKVRDRGASEIQTNL